jgi:predicted ATP-binding protein involved in virulence
VNLHKERVPLDELSDGYQSVIALATDVLSVFLPVWGNLIETAEGIVLIDEIDAHLHPTWKMRIVELLRACFPHVQFITTTHDPLCLRGLRRGEVMVLQRGAAGRVVAVKDLPSPEGMSVDQLLTSEHFGLSSILEPGVDALFRRYYRLLASKRRTPEQDKTLKTLKATLAKLNHMGRTRREQIMLQVIDQYLAEGPPATRAEQAGRRDRLLNRLIDVWTAGLPGGASAGNAR